MGLSNQGIQRGCVLVASLVGIHFALSGVMNHYSSQSANRVSGSEATDVDVKAVKPQPSRPSHGTKWTEK